MTIVERLDGIRDGLGVKAPVRVATTANITLSGLQTVDGVALAEGDRVLVKDQTTATENGIYNASTGVWERSKDFDGHRDVINGTRVNIGTTGTVNGATEWALSTADPITIGTSALSFSNVSDMTIAIYDPTGKAGDAFSAANHIFTRAVSGAASRTMLSRASQRVDVRDWANWGTTAANNSAVINAALAEAFTNGSPSVVNLPAGSFDISDTIVQTQNFVAIEGAGGGYIHDYVTQVWNTRLRWTGASGGTMMRVAPVSSATNRALTDWRVSGIFFDGNLLANRGLELLSVKNGVLRQCMFTKQMTYALYTGVVASLGEARDPQQNIFEQLSFRHITGTEGDATAIYFDGDATANTSYNALYDIIIQHTNQTAFHIANGDNNDGFRIRIYRVLGAGVGMIFGAGASALFTARSNRFRRVYAEGGITAQGTEIAAAPSYNNIVEIDTENGTPTPTVGTGASLVWSNEYSGRWTAYTPTVTPGSGVYTNVTATGQYKLDGNQVTVCIKATYTNVGTGATNTQISVPFAPKGFSGIFFGEESGSSGLSLSGVCAAAATSFTVRRYDAGLLVPLSGYVVEMTGTYPI